MSEQPQEETRRVETEAPLTPEQVTNAYVKSFFNGSTPDPSIVQSGVIMDPRRVVELIRRNAQPADEFTENAKKLIQGPPTEIVDDAAKTVKALNYAWKKTVPPKKHVMVETAPGSGSVVTTENFVKALKTLGKTKIRVYSERPDSPVYLANSQGDIVVMAPVMQVSPSEITTIKRALALQQ